MRLSIGCVGVTGTDTKTKLHRELMSDSQRGVQQKLWQQARTLITTNVPRETCPPTGWSIQIVCSDIEKGKKGRREGKMRWQHFRTGLLTL